jgi:hypothetical protein
MGAAPRIAPPVPLHSRIREFREAARLAGVVPMPWQLLAARILLGVTSARQYPWRGRWLYPEAALVVARQNGKTTFLVPRIVLGLRAGERIIHTAQNRELPREVFGMVADVMGAAGLAAGVHTIRLANGQEEIRMWNGGRYRIVAPTRGGARGHPSDLVIVDEAREMDSFEFIAAAEPTLTTSRHPQMLYLSNAGDDGSVVLNGLRRRADLDPRLGYLEWSSAPERALDDHEGWAEANPALGITIREEYLEDRYRAHSLAGTLGIFETEHLCRWVASLMPRMVGAAAWDRAGGELEAPNHPALGVSFDPGSGRASAVLAWMQSDGTAALTLAADVTGDPLDVDELGRLLAVKARELLVPAIGFDSATDADLARYLGKRARSIVGKEFAAASSRFAAMVDGGRLRHAGAAAVGADLAFTSKASTLGERGAFHASRARADRPITASLAAIRAVWLATEPLTRRPAIY